MVWKLELASDKDATTWEDITDLIYPLGAFFAGTANRGEIDGGSGFNLNDKAGGRVLPKRRKLRLTEDAVSPGYVMWQGRTIGDTLNRGVVKTDDAKLFDVNCVDVNADFGGIAFSGTQRPAESDNARIRYLLDTYLGGQARPSTQITEAYFPETNDYALTAHLYADVQLIDWFTHITDTTHRQFFLTKDYDLFYDTLQSTAYAAGIVLSDTGYDFSTIFPPGDVSATEDATELWTRVRAKLPDGRFASVIRTAAETANDQWGTTIAVEDGVHLSDATAEANLFLDEFSTEQTTYACSVDLPADRVDTISWGMTISFRAAAAGVLAPTTFRISRCSWEYVGIDVWRAHLELNYPTKFERRGKPVGPPVTGPVPFVPGVPFQYGVGSIANASATASASLPVPAGTGSTLIIAISAEDDGGTNRALSTGGYSLIHTALGHSSQSHLLIYTKTAAGGEQTVTDNAGNGRARIVIVEVQGTIEDTSEVDNGSSSLSTFTAATINPTTVGAKGMVLAFFDAYYQDYNVGTLTPAGSLVELNETYFGIGRLVAWFGYIQTNSLASSYAPAVNSTVVPASNDAANTWASAALVLSLTDDPVGHPASGQLVVEPAFSSTGTTTTGSPTSYPYAPASLIATVNGVSVPITETNPSAGTYTFATAPPLGADVVIKYISTGQTF